MFLAYGVFVKDAALVHADLYVLGQRCVCVKDAALVHTAFLFVHTPLSNTSFLAGLAITLARHFIWYKNIMWADDLPKEGRAVAFLSSNDVIVPSASVRNYLKDHGVESRWLENCGHAGFLKKTQWIEDIAKEVGRRGATSVGGTKKSN